MATTKTGKEVQGDVLELLRGSSLASMITGGVYRNGTRPRGSALEDAVVTFTAGLTGEIQTGVVTINVYVKDINNGANGVLVENGARTAAIERAAQDWVDSLTADRSGYLFQLQSAIHTSIDSVLDEHYVVIRLGYRYYSTD